MKLEKVNQDKVSIHAEAKQEYKNVLVGSIKPHKNHTLFEYNTSTKELRKAEFEKIGVNFNDLVKGTVSDRKKVVTKEYCLYHSALNKKNAIRYFSRLLKIKPTEIICQH